MVFILWWTLFISWSVFPKIPLSMFDSLFCGIWTISSCYWDCVCLIISYWFFFTINFCFYPSDFILILLTPKAEFYLFMVIASLGVLLKYLYRLFCFLTMAVLLLLFLYWSNICILSAACTFLFKYWLRFYSSILAFIDWLVFVMGFCYSMFISRVL